MTTTFACRNEQHIAGGPWLRVEVGEGGIRQLTPSALGEDLLIGPVGPRLLGGDGRTIALLEDYIGSATGDHGWNWHLDTELATGTWEAEFATNGVRIEYDLKVQENSAFASVLSIPLDGREGWALLPGETAPFDLSNPIRASKFVKGNAWAFGSQGGLLVKGEGSRKGQAPAIFLERMDERRWVAHWGFAEAKANARLKGSVELMVIPFNGAMRLDQLLATTKTRTKRSANGNFEKKPERAELELDGCAKLNVLGTKVCLRVLNENVAVEPETLEKAEVTTRAAILEGEEVVEITLDLEAAADLASVRVEVEVESPCGNPTWEGDATVFIPGNFARCNYHPKFLHGGGPKWGTSPTPIKEPLTANDEAAGCCHGWTFASSRLPQVWAAAVDRKARRMVWIGTTPRSDLGECCAGFVSPKRKTTTLKLATPTTYEPWTPLGYSRMRAEPRRDGTRLLEGDRVRWTFWVAVRETRDLNAWAPLERALYLRNRPLEPTPLKLTRDEAIRACASAIHERFFDAKRNGIKYSTGPQGNGVLIGFTGMAHSALVMLEGGGAARREAGVRVLDSVAAMFLAGPEFPWTAMEDDGTYKHASGEPGYVIMTAFDNLAEAVRREKKRRRKHPKWEEALLRCARAWVRNQSKEGAYPHWGPGFSKDFKKSEYGCTNVEAGVMANMVDAFELFGDRAFLDSAVRAAEKYGRDLDDGRLCGGPGDIRALVNSEVPMFFLRGFRRLYEKTKDERHRRWMLASAAWRTSFQFAHSWPVEKGSPLWRQGWSGLGAEGASACNLHAVAFGCINVPDYWALWKMTGDAYWKMRCEDLVRYSAQQYARFAGDLGFPFAGAGTESWWASESVWGKGYPWIFTEPGFDLGYMSWVTGWSGYGAIWARDLGIEF